MASLPLRFAQPEDPNLKALRVYEAGAAIGPFIQIDRTEAIGVFPEYVVTYTTNNAAVLNDWFAIAWEDIEGHVGEMSSPIRGGTTTLVALVTDRVLQRDRNLDADVVRQEAEAAIEYYFNANPYAASLGTLPDNNQYRVLNGLTYLTLARTYMIVAITHEGVESASLGIVSFKTQVGTRQQVDFQQLIDLANLNLGLNTSLVMQLDDVYNMRKHWDIWFEDWKVNWDQLPWILGIPHWSLPG